MVLFFVPKVTNFFKPDQGSKSWFILIPSGICLVVTMRINVFDGYIDFPERLLAS